MSTSTTKQKKTAFAGPSTRGGLGASKASRRGPVASIDSQSKVRKSVYGGTSRTVLSSSSRAKVQVGGSDKMVGPQKAPVTVMDDGRDVTPLPLIQVDPNAVRSKQSNILADGSVGTPTDLMSQASIYQTGTITASTFGGGPFTRSVFSASQSGRSTSSIGDDMTETETGITSGWTDTKVQYKREEVAEQLTEDDLEKIIDINLSETETLWLLDMPGICVSLESEEANTVRAQTIRYQELIRNRVGNDRYAERGMVTFNEAPKYKNVQTTKITYNDTGVNASNWDMYDTYKYVEEMEAKAKAEAEENEDVKETGTASVVPDDAEKADSEKEGKVTPGSQTGSMVKEGTQVSITKALAPTSRQSTRLSKQNTVISVGQMESQGTMSSLAATDSVFASKESGVTAVPDQEPADHSGLLQSEALKKDLVTMERVVNLNTYQPKQASYRGYDIIADIDMPVPEEAPKKPQSAGGAIVVADMGPNLDRLWAYQCPLTKGRNVSCLAWNKSNPDLLAIGYGQFEYSKQKGGLVCCWSLKNPEYPERVYHTESGVTSLDFSQAHANLLAAGLYEGTVAIFNVRSTNNEPVLDSFEASGKHTGPIWQLKWIEKERGSGEEKIEVLVSISTDGRVTQWSIRKGFESYDLMKLKRVSAKTNQGKAKKAEAFISRFAGGLCFDFSVNDSNIYLAGTEDGHIHKCSCSYNEQYLDSYYGHTGPVYGIQWSPFSPDVFLSCSGDWSCRMWHQDRLQPILTFLSSTKSVPCMCWSPSNSTVFACVNEGAIEVWDLSQSTLDPIIDNSFHPGAKLSSVSFSKNSSCILVGDSEGNVSVFELHGMPPPPENQVEALQKVIQSSLASQLPKKQP